MTPAVTLDQLGPLPDFLRQGAGAPVARVRAATGDLLWLVSDYELGRRVLTDTRFSRAAAAAPGAPRFSDSSPSHTAMTSMDGAGHARLRKLVVGAFTPRRVAALTSSIEHLTDHLLDDLERGDRPADLITAFAAPLPFTVLRTLLGIPVEDREVFGEFIGVLFDMTASTPRERARQGFALYDYMSTLLDRKRREPRDDLLSALTQSHDGGMLSQTELVDLGIVLLTAGYETTVGQIGMSVLSLLLTPGGWGSVPATTAAIEELLRLTPATPLSFPRVALEDVRVGEITVEAGQAVVVCLLHGNRDEKVFASPDLLLAEGRSSAHLTFGHGAHYCLGAPLARLQLGIAVGGLFRRFPGLRLAERDDAVQWSDGLAIRGLSSLMVTW